VARPREFDEERVLDAVMETFWSRGYEGTSAQDLVDATGLGRGSLYAAYANKDGLFEQAIIRYNRRSRETVERMRRPGPVLERLRELLRGVIDANHRGSEKRGCLATNTAIERAGKDSHVADLVRQNFQIMINGIRETIARGQTAGELSVDHSAEDLTLFVFNAMQGLRVMTKLTSSKDRKRLAATVELTLHSLGCDGRIAADG
jgi:TetR/AcrR family transcriptional regulator, transcriptional repressor for nem operon